MADKRKQRDERAIVQTRRERKLEGLEFDKEQARRFLGELYNVGDGEFDDTQFTFQIHDERKCLGPVASEKDLARGQVFATDDMLFPSTIRKTLGDAWDELCHANLAGCGVFVTVNKMKDGSTGRKASDFDCALAVVNDLDDGEPDKDYPVEPSFRVSSSASGFHDYFLMDKPGALSLEEWRDIQKQVLYGLYKGDKAVCDAARVMRLPGFYHRKTAEPHLVQIVDGDGDNVAVFSGARLKEAFPVDAAAKEACAARKAAERAKAGKSPQNAAGASLAGKRKKGTANRQRLPKGSQWTPWGRI